MSQSAPRWLRAVKSVCSDELWTQVAEPSLADLTYERTHVPGIGYRQVCVGYWRIVLAVAIALPADVLTNHRLSTVTLLRIVVAVAFPGLTPSLGFGDSSRQHGRSPDKPTGGR